jgi:ribonuclease PH
MVALRIAINKLLVNGSIKEDPIINNIAAVSIGVVDNTAILDLCYSEDCGAEVDMNIIMTDKNEFVEIQGTAEWKTFTRNKMNEMLDIAEKGINNIFKVQEDVI